MPRHWPKTTWAKLKSAFVEGASQRAISRATGIPLGSIAARCWRKKWARDRIDWQKVLEQ
jgi:hypothetical protein